ncbi:MAG: fibronectin type III domain-containing protein [Ignavibacteriae bacterium]|nr:fibronectin type III domain-containing protein [Ignavibacteriota bacterium]
MIRRKNRNLKFIFLVTFCSLLLTQELSAQFISPPTLISPANGSGNLSAPVTLTWSSSASSFHVQVAADASFNNLLVDVSGISNQSFVINVLAGGTKYYWRVNASSFLFTSDWSSVWNFTSASRQTIPPAPALISPANNSTNQPTTIVLSWNASTGADHYWIQIATDQTFSNPTIGDSTIRGTSYQANNLTTSTNYFWRVKAINSAGSSSWSSVWNFTTVSGQIQPPLQPTLVSPLDKSVNQPTSITFNWNSASNADHYLIQVATDQTFSSMVYTNYTITGTSQQVNNLQNNKTYFWQVRAANAGGQSPWSATWSFTTSSQATLEAPALSSPVNGATNQPTTLTLSWGNAANATSYNLQVAKDSTFNNKVFNDSTITSNYKQVNTLAQATQYFWRVNARNNTGISNWSSVWNFTTVSQQTIPSAPVLVSPTNGTTDEPLNPILLWSSIVSAAKYRLQLAMDFSFSNIIFDDSTITTSSKQVGPLTQATQYFWRVNARNNSGISNWSSVWNFTTLNNENFVPVLISPSDGIGNIPLTTLCVWDSVKNAQQYQIQVSKQPNFSLIVISDSTTKTNIQLESLDNYTTYYWRVRAKVTNNWRQYCSAWRFTTRSSTPTYFNIDTTITFPSYEDLSSYKSSDYKIIGLPGTSHIPIINFLPGTRLQDWQAYWDNGAPDGYLLDYNENNFFFSIGKAFWIIKKGPIRITATIENAPLNNNNNVEIPLHGGWNMITNPLTFPVDWDSVKTINNITEPVYSYNGAFNISDTFKPFEGFYYFNSTNLSKLEIPSKFSGRISSSGKKNLNKQTSSKNWTVKIKLNVEGQVDSAAWFGVSSSSTNDYNKLNSHKPRNWGTTPTIYFMHPEWDKDYPVFASDIKPSFANSSEWTFEIKSHAWKPVSLTFNLKEFPGNLNIYLFNIVSNKWINLRENPSTQNLEYQYQFTPVSSKTSVKIMVGKESQDNLKVSTPSDFDLGNNYPNPFNLSTTIPVSMPVQSEVEISVYNIIGNQIKTIYKGMLGSGKHWFRWDGTDDKGNIISSGIYFYRLSDNSKIDMIKKMILMK